MPSLIMRLVYQRARRMEQAQKSVAPSATQSHIHSFFAPVAAAANASPQPNTKLAATTHMAIRAAGIN
jgi:hypothetical protein